MKIKNILFALIIAACTSLLTTSCSSNSTADEDALYEQNSIDRLKIKKLPTNGIDRLKIKKLPTNG